MGRGASSEALAFFWAHNLRTSIYVDGFNLYFGALKGTPYKWLDICALCRALLAQHNRVGTVKYFTANVSPTPGDPHKPIHQQVYIRALMAMHPQLEVIRGQFTTHEVTRRLVTPVNGQRYANILERTEKGSDVNLAVHLVNDAWRDEYDCAVVISGDSDLAEAIRLVREYHPKKVVGVFSPGKGKVSKQLQVAANFIRAVSTNALAASQLPNEVKTATTVLTKPVDW